jgi:predicted nucleic acid-binding protein
MIGTTGDVFVDTNVLVYARDSAAGPKQARAAEWMAFLWRSGRGRLSMQVLHEYYHTVTRKLQPGLDAAAARQEARQLMQWQPVELSPAVLERGWSLQDQYAISFWDALIIAAAQVARCEYLLTEDLQDGQSLGGVVVVNPFQLQPHAIQ